MDQHLRRVELHDSDENRRKTEGELLTNPIKLPPRLDLAAAQKLLGDVSEADLSQTVELDASDVDHLGTLCVQVLIAAARAAKEAGGKLSISNLSERVESQLETMGLSGDALMEGAT